MYLSSATTPRSQPSAADFPDIPDIITSGGSLYEAFANACEALDLHLESLQKLGMDLPEPRHRLVMEPTTSLYELASTNRRLFWESPVTDQWAVPSCKIAETGRSLSPPLTPQSP